MRMLRLLGLLTLGAAAAGLLAACGHIKSADALVKAAEKRYGKCTLLSKEETADGSTVHLRDELQGFSYTMTSAMNSIDLDGSHLGDAESTRSDFLRRLAEYIRQQTEPEIAEICGKAGAEYVFAEEIETVLDPFLTVRADDTAQGADTALACAAALQKQNLSNRFDGAQIDVYTKDGSPAGYVLLPENTFTEADTQRARFFRNEAENLCRNYGAGLDTFKVVRLEHITFADTGLPLERLQPSPNFGYTKSMDQPVTAYYFSCQGREFFIMDFEDTKTSLHYTNFREVFPEK